MYAAWDTAGLLEGRSATVPVLSRELHEMQSSDLLPRSPSLVPGREGVGDLRVAHPASGPLSKFTLDNLVCSGGVRCRMHVPTGIANQRPA